MRYKADTLIMFSAIHQYKKISPEITRQLDSDLKDDIEDLGIYAVRLAVYVEAIAGKLLPNRA